MDELINEEAYLLKGLQLRAKIYALLQGLGFLCCFYLANDMLDFIFDETKWLLIFIAAIAYLLFFMILTLRIAFKKNLQTDVAKKQLNIIFILDLIPVFILMLVPLSDIF